MGGAQLEQKEVSALPTHGDLKYAVQFAQRRARRQLIGLIPLSQILNCRIFLPLSGAGASVCNFARPIKRNLFHRPIRPIHNTRTSVQL